MNCDIAIIGMAARLPEAKTVDDFYLNLRAGRDSIRPISLRRKCNTTIDLTKNYQHLAFIEDIDTFDPSFFGISMSEAVTMAPQQRLLLEVVYEAIENAGRSIDDFSGSQTDVFVADTELEYYKHADSFEPTLLTGNKNAAIAGRISRFFNLHGKAVMIDTTCSSSLAALYFAANELVLGESDYAIVCAANLHLFPTERGSEIRMGIESASEKVKTFSAEADGTIGGEAVTCFVLKRLDEAIAQQDIIHAVIKGAAMNQDAARSSSLTAPDSKAQAEVIKNAWKKAGGDPRSITYIEAHGTGTKLGDPIEIQGIDEAFRFFTDDKGFCAVSAVKSNIGHADSAAGAVGLLKVVLSLKYKELFPSLHFNQPNPFIDFDQSAVYVNTVLKKWEPVTGVRRAAVSSFGIMGTNCHVVLEESPASRISAGEPSASGAYLITVSGKSGEALADNLQSLLKFVVTHPDTSLADLSYTLIAGRKHYPYRYVTIATSLDSLAESLRHAGVGEHAPREETKLIIALPNRIDLDRKTHALLYSRYGAYREAFEACYRLMPGNVPGDGRIETFTFGYSIYQLLVTYGLKSQFLLGFGVGKWIMKVLRGEMSLEEGVQAVIADNAPDYGNLDERVRKFYDQEKAHDLTLVAIGPEEAFARAMKRENPHRGKVICLQPEAPDPLLQYMKELYAADAALSWKSVASVSPGRRISLPPYQFQRKRCWLKPALRFPFSQWLYKLAWTPLDLVVKPRIQSGLFAVWMDGEGLGDALVQRIEKEGATCVRIYQAVAYEKISQRHYCIDWSAPDHYARMINEMEQASSRPDVFIHLGACRSNDHTDQDLNAGIFSAMNLIQVCDRGIREHKTSVMFITRNARQVLEKEAMHFPIHSTLHGFINSVTAEYPEGRFKCVDIAQGDGWDVVVAGIVGEASFSDPYFNVAYRQGRRYVPALREQRLTSDTANIPRTGAVVLVTGGASGIGLEITRKLAEEKKYKVMVLGRSVIPPQREWNNIIETGSHPHLPAIKVFQRMIDQGLCVEYYATDVGDAGALRKTIAGINEAHGEICGVVHAAGIPGKKRVKSHTIESFKEALVPKVYGTLNLLRSLDTSRLSFLVMFSSDDAIIGAERGTNYSAANMFLDQVVYTLRSSGVPAKVISWPSWSETGMWQRFNVHSQMPANNPLHLTNDEGLGVFMELLERDFDHVILSKKDPNELMGNNPYFHAASAPSGATEALSIPVSPVHNTNETQEKPLVMNASWNGYQNAIAAIWKEVLQQDDLTLQSDFFDLGGHSLLAIDLIGTIETRFSIQLEFDDIFKYPTIEALSAFVEGLKRSTSPKSAGIPNIEEQEYYDLAAGQYGLWNLCQIPEASVAYNSHMEYKITGSLKPDVLYDAVALLLEKHESLRTVIRYVGNTPKQKVLPFRRSLAEKVFIYRDQVEATYDGDIHSQINDIVQQQINFADGPLLKLYLLKSGNDEYVFIHLIHHIISDGWSEGLLLSELMNFYQALLQGIPVKSQLSIQYKDYCGWINQQINRNDHHAYWAARLSPAITPLALPEDHPRPVLKTYHGDMMVFQMDADICRRMKDTAKRNNVSLFIVLVSLIKLLLYKYTRQTDIAIGTVLSGRGHKELNEQIGLFINTIVLRTGFSEDDSYEDLLMKVRDTVIGAYEHQVLPLHAIIEEIGYKVLPDRSPLFDVFVILHNRRQEGDATTPGLAFSKLSRPAYNAALYDISLEFNETDTSLEVNLIYNTDIFRRETIELMKHRFLMLVEEAMRNETAGIDKLDFRLPFETEMENAIRQKFDIEEAF